MRVCRYAENGESRVAFYHDEFILPLERAVALYSEAGKGAAAELAKAGLLDCLPPDGSVNAVAREVAAWVESNADAARERGIAADQAQLLAPIARPPKLFLLAGNYAKHIEEGGGVAVMRKETFPYVFMKPITTINHPGSTVKIPDISPNHIDWEAELGIVIGRKAKGVTEADALNYVAGYMVINDISDRKFRPNPDRKQREKDGFFDWLHGKWHDGFCVMGPCITSSDTIPDPQTLALKLTVNGDVKQDANTSQMIFPAAGVIEFISSFVTLEPGDVISTGTAAGVGNASSTYFKPGDEVAVSFDKIGVLKHHIG